MTATKPNPLRDLLDPEYKDQPLAEFDWAAAGVTRKFLIIFSGRTGSTLLTKLVKSTDLCGSPEEYLSNHYVKNVVARLPMNTAAYLQYLAERFTKKGIFGIEIDTMRLRFLHELIDFGRVFSPSDTPYIWLTRRDVIAQAYSFAAAMNSGLWHSIEGQADTRRDDLMQVGKQVDDAQMTRQILKLLQEEADTKAFFERIGVEPFTLHYEDLVTDKPLTLMRVLDHVGALSNYFTLEGLSGNPTKQLSYDSKSQFIVEFERRNRELATYLRNHRDSIDIAKVKALAVPR